MLWFCCCLMKSTIKCNDIIVAIPALHFCAVVCGIYNSSMLLLLRVRDDLSLFQHWCCCCLLTGSDATFLNLTLDNGNWGWGICDLTDSVDGILMVTVFGGILAVKTWTSVHIHFQNNFISAIYTLLLMTYVTPSVHYVGFFNLAIHFHTKSLWTGLQ